MKRQNRRIALALALVMLLTPALALADFDPNNVDLANGSVVVGSANTMQGTNFGPHGGNPVNITDSGTSTGSTVLVATQSGAVTPQVNVTGVAFTGPTDPADHSAAITIEGDGEASVALDGVTVTGDNPAIDVEGGAVNLDLTGLSADIDEQGAAMSVNDSTVNITVHGENTVNAEGIGLSVNNADVTVTGGTAGDKLTITSASQSSTISGEDTSTLTVEGEATLTAVNTAGAEPIAESGPSVTGEVKKQTVEQTKTTTITATGGTTGGGTTGGGTTDGGVTDGGVTGADTDEPGPTEAEKQAELEQLLQLLNDNVVGSQLLEFKLLKDRDGNSYGIAVALDPTKVFLDGVYSITIKDGFNWGDFFNRLWVMDLCFGFEVIDGKGIAYGEQFIQMTYDIIEVEAEEPQGRLLINKTEGTAECTCSLRACKDLDGNTKLVFYYNV